ncbi:MAG: HlyD family efflux transporter periplasmic adaptor subunit [Bryobacteraceae bacterium]
MNQSHLTMRLLLSAALLFLSFGCGRNAPPIIHAASTSPANAAAQHHQVRLSGVVQAVHFYNVQVPQITGQGGRVTLTRLVANGTQVKAGDVVVEFDRTQQLDNARDAQAKFDDLSHQVDQKRAQNHADAAKREADMQKAEADLAKAEIELRKGPLLSEIDRLKNEVKAEDARAHVASLKKSNGLHDQADAAAVRILELQRDRQKVGLERAQTNAEKLQIHTPLAGMAALLNVWRNGNMGHAQEGDQLWQGQPLVRIFDPAEMEVRVTAGEPDGAALTPGSRAIVKLDAYPELEFHATCTNASPVATSALGSPIKNFTAVYHLEKTDPHLLPDLSAAVILEGSK